MNPRHPFHSKSGRQLFAAVACAAFAAVLAGCSGNSNASSSASDAPSASAASSAAPDAAGSTAPDAGGSAGPEAAAGGGGGGGRAGGRRIMAQALATVGLSDDQKAQIRSIMADARKQNEGADPLTRRANYRAAFQKIDAVLTPDQRTMLHAKMAELRKERQENAQSSS